MTSLLDDLAVPQRRALDLVKEVAVDKSCRPFLVGGPVRDLMLGRHAIDIDLTLETDSSTLARALAKRINGRVRSFPQFLTYKVTAEQLPEIDIATARKERYRSPGALPTVTAGRLKDDLLRRDFSINAIALDVLGGALHDPTNGEADLRARLVRVLHDRSFIDDPTRIFRAIRLATRLGFALEPHTAELMRGAIRADGLATISRERIWRELFLAMEEADAPHVLFALRDEGALDVLFGPHRDDPILLERLEAFQRRIAANPDLDREVMYAAAMLTGNATPIELEGSGFSQKRARNVVQIANELPRFSDALAEATTDHQRFRIFKSASPEMLQVISAMHPAHAEHTARFQEYRDFKLPLRGTDLEVPAGPHIARALEQTREAVFTGECTPEDARAFARELAMQYFGEARIEN
ncbi:MAG: CCA tRNA nucleotidyltransferase [Acidobacteria bacterium]|nr:CCA tRNA nucleotidyltransferase [Acidobacteriota bacterium]